MKKEKRRNKIKLLSNLFNREKLETKAGWIKLINIQYLEVLESDRINVHFNRT